MIDPKECLGNISPYKMPETGRKYKTRLDMNENTRGCSPKVMDAIRNVKQDDIAMYPEYHGFVEKIANFHNIASESILLTNGADDAFRCIMACYLDRDDKIILPIPNYPMFEIFAKQNNAKVVEVLYNSDFTFPAEKLIHAQSEKTKMVIVVSPGNLLGSSIELEDLIKILNEAKNAIILLDETYYQFAKRSFVPLVCDYQNLIIVQSFSKVYGLAGLRLGYIVSDHSNIEQLRKVNLPFAANSLAVIAGNAAIDDQAFIDEFVYEVKNEKEFLSQRLKKAGIDVRMTDSNYLLINFGDGADKIYEELKFRNVLLKNLKDYPLLKGFLRMTVGTHSENLVLLEVLGDILSKTLI